MAEALVRAARAKDSNELYDYHDTSQRYLILRQRGPRAGWFVRAQGQMRRIGNAKREPGDKQFLTVKQARDKAGGARLCDAVVPTPSHQGMDLGRPRPRISGLAANQAHEREARQTGQHPRGHQGLLRQAPVRRLAKQETV
ncbi:hypothetical protein MTX20_05655 [Bradyrhizobium sp. ISRA435]|nr:hypothetical protein MTX20_05655 [Bradyrhizobium sp. ISRA435]